MFFCWCIFVPLHLNFPSFSCPVFCFLVTSFPFLACSLYTGLSLRGALRCLCIHYKTTSLINSPIISSELVLRTIALILEGIKLIVRNYLCWTREADNSTRRLILISRVIILWVTNTTQTQLVYF